jgi:hypothetical protein
MQPVARIARVARDVQAACLYTGRPIQTPAPLLRRILEAVERGKLTAPGPMISHLEGSLAALEALEKPQKRPSRKTNTQ